MEEAGRPWAGELAQELRAFTDLIEDSSPVPSTHQAAEGMQRPRALCWPLEALYSCAQTPPRWGTHSFFNLWKQTNQQNKREKKTPLKRGLVRKESTVHRQVRGWGSCPTAAGLRAGFLCTAQLQQGSVCHCRQHEARNKHRVLGEHHEGILGLSALSVKSG